MTKTKRKTEEFSDETLDALLAGHETPDEIFGEDGLFKRLQSALIERALGAELTHHLGYPLHGPAAGDDRRNGHGAKTVETETGSLAIRVPRDRDGDFTPQLVKKGQRRLEGFDDKVLSLYARGMSMREIQGHLEELYGTDVSPELISTVTDAYPIQKLPFRKPAGQRPAESALDPQATFHKPERLSRKTVVGILTRLELPPALGFRQAARPTVAADRGSETASIAPKSAKATLGLKVRFFSKEATGFSFRGA